MQGLSLPGSEFSDDHDLVLAVETGAHQQHDVGVLQAAHHTQLVEDLLRVLSRDA
jgi:hypothetical protein